METQNIDDRYARIKRRMSFETLTVDKRLVRGKVYSTDARARQTLGPDSRVFLANSQCD